MAATRILLGVFLAGVLAGPAFAQPGLSDPAAGGAPPPFSSGSGVPPVIPPVMPGNGGPTATLTAPPGQPVPPGTVPSPWCGPLPVGAACCGPVGANGPVTYELYARTGPDLVIGGSSDFSAALRTGWTVAGGGRALLFNTAGDAAWVLDLGLMFTYNGGDQNRILNVFNRQPRNATTNQLNGPDVASPFVVRDLFRTNFTYAIGRDWFLNGPGVVGSETSWNSRANLDVGGIWGTNHVNLIPVANRDQYTRRQGVSEGVFVGAGWNCEVPMGAWILFGGARVQWMYTWTNLIPPSDGNLQDIYLLLTAGVRF